MTATALQRLLKYPHAAVFDKTPAAELALRLRHPSGAVWSVADEVLTASAAGVETQYSLAEHTVGSLASALEAEGYEIAYLSPELADRSAMVLVEGSGDERASNGDHLTAFTSPLWVLLSGYAGEVREAEYQSRQALRQMVITQAEGEWLDLWGALYAEGRLPGENDAAYAPRIPEEAFRVRVNGMAIEKAVKDRTGRNVEIREPWKKMFALDISSLSGDHHFQDDHYYSYFVIHPVARDQMDWPGVLPIIDRNRPAGIEIYPPAIEFSARHVTVQPPVEYAVRLATTELFSMFADLRGENPLGIMRLSENEFTINHRLMSYQLRGLSNAVGLDEPQLVSLPRNIAYASICLSEHTPLGDENAILSRGLVSSEAVPPESMSDELAPSDYDVLRKHERVERITLDQHAAGEMLAPTPVVGSKMERFFPMRFYAARIEENVWAGGWSDQENWFGADRTMGMTIINTHVGDILNDTLMLNVSVIT